jgi:hypothetical protein
MKIKKKLIKLFGIILSIPLPISCATSVAGMIARKATYERWLFDENIFPLLDWAKNSYIKALILWFGATIMFILYVRLITFCFLYEEEYEDTNPNPQ